MVPEGGMTFEMETYLRRVSQEMQAKADSVLELNPDHPVFAALQLAVAQDPEKAKKYVKILHTQALMMADLPVENAGEYTELAVKVQQISGFTTLAEDVEAVKN